MNFNHLLFYDSNVVEMLKKWAQSVLFQTNSLKSGLKQKNRCSTVLLEYAAEFCARCVPWLFYAQYLH